MHAIETTHLTRRFGRCEAVHDLDLRVPAGSIFALLGPNGAGKTTTIKLVMNLLSPTSGHARVLGVDTRHLGPREWQRIGYVSENQEVPGWMSGRELLAYHRPFYPAWDHGLEDRLRERLAVDLDTPIERLSRGNRMKVALLSSLAYAPELVVLDEPFSGLDPLVREELVQALLEVPRDREWTVLVSSHDVDEVERLADHVGFIAGGRLQLADPVESLLARFRSIEVIGSGDAPPPMPTRPEWLPQGSAGRTLRFMDSAYSAEEGQTRISSAFPGASVVVHPVTLRDVFLALARSSALMEAV